MIVSKNGTSYDNSNGSEQPHAASADPRQRSDREEINRWEDDGPGPHSRAAASAADVPPKPAWSVLSLRNLLEAVRLLGRSGEAPQQLPQPDAAGGENARRDPYRNHWENT
jgi:hypothetical protein